MERIGSPLNLFLLRELAAVLHLAQVLQGHFIVIRDIIHCAEYILQVLLVPASDISVFTLLCPEEVVIGITVESSSTLVGAWLD